MTDKEWIEQIEAVSNEELYNSLLYCGHDDYYNNIYRAVVKEIKRRLDNPSSAQKQGRWIQKDNIYGVAYCSECDYELHTDDTNYCPNCGARMEEQE